MVDASIQQLNHFLLVADYGNFHLAAEHVHRTQPAISLSIRQLENKLGQPLFEPNRKAVQLTAFGVFCLPRVRQLVELHNRTLREITAISEGRFGDVRLAAVPSVATRLIPLLLTIFEARYPEVNLTLSDDNAPNVQAMVTNGQVELGIASLAEPDPALNFEPLMEDRMGLVCRRDHPILGAAQAPRTLNWADLSDYRLIGNFTTRLLKGTQAETIVQAATHYSVSNMTSILALIRAGLGAAILPQLALVDEANELCFCPLNRPVIQRELGLLSLAGRELLPAAAGLRDLVLEQTATLNQG